MRLGVHCSVRGGLVNALVEAKRLECDTVQIFTRSPRMWRAGKIKPEDAEAFRRTRQEYGITPLVVHTPYLPNLCTSDEALYARSYRALIEDLENCTLIGADFLVIHPGAYSEGSTRDEGIRRLTDAINRGMDHAGGPVVLLLENVAGGGRRMGMTFEELKEMLNGMKHSERVAICLDTAHTLAAGYPFSKPEEVQTTLEKFDKVIGLRKLKVIHANDSKAPLGSHRDLHQHIGKGHLGKSAFLTLLHHPALTDCAVILETPKETPQSDPMNLKLMRRLMK